METMQAVFGRKSYRGGFTGAPVPREDLREIMEAGLAAPSGHNLQTTQLIGVDDPELLRRLADCFPHSGMTTVGAMVVVLAKKIQCEDGAFYHVEDFAAATENMLLAIHDKGYASVWLQGVVRGEPAARMAAILGVPREVEVVVCLPIGIPAGPFREAPKAPFEDRAWFNGYQV